MAFPPFTSNIVAEPLAVLDPPQPSPKAMRAMRRLAAAYKRRLKRVTGRAHRSRMIRRSGGKH